MHQTTILLLFLSFSFLVKAQTPTNPFPENWEPGKCYAILEGTSEKVTVAYHEERYFKVSPPIWKTVIDTFYGQKNTERRAVIREGNIVYSRRKNRWASAPAGTYLYLCKVEVPVQSKTVVFTENDTIQFIKRKHLLQDSKIIQISKEKFPDILLDEGQCYGSLEQDNTLRFFKLKAGNWSNMVEVFSGCGNRFTVQKVQQALIDIGYDIKLDNIMDQETKDALLDFQKKQNLPVGLLDLETLKRLGLM